MKITLTQKDLRSIELASKYERHNLAENLHDHHFFIDTLIYLHEALTEQKIEIKYWQKMSEVLLYKFSFHGLTLHNILSGLTLHSNYYKEEMEGKTIIDIGSAKAVLRAQMEAFLMYHYIYVNPADEDMKELRYNAWIYSSLLQRQDFPSETEYAQKQKAKDAIELDKMKSSIRNLNSFQLLTPNQQERLLRTGSGKLFSHWATILKETGFTEQNAFYDLYNYLSIYAHSEGLSAIQLEYQPDAFENAVSQANLDLHHSKLLACLMISSIVNLFESVNKKLKTLPETTQWDIELYSMLAKGQRMNP